VHVAKLAGVFPLLLRGATIRRTPGVFTICSNVEQWLLEKVGVLAVIDIRRDAWKGEIECAVIEWRQSFSWAGRCALE
jgi:hypothetical protein